MERFDNYMLRRVSSRSLLVAAFAGGGVLAAHFLGYRSVAHTDEHHTELLAATGHEYFTYVIVGVLAITALLLSRYVSRRLGERRTPDVSGVQLFAQGAVRIIPLQGVAFLLLELGERALFAGGLSNVLAEPAVLMGLFFQVIVGLVAAVLLSVFAAVVESVRRRNRNLAARRGATRIYPKAVFRPHGLAVSKGGSGLRSPPSAA